MTAGRLLLLFLLGIAAVEAILMILVGHTAGWLVVLAETVLMAVVGVAVMAGAWLRFGRSLRDAHEPFDDAQVSHVLLLVAGLLLLIPGLIADTVALLLLIPAVRRLVATLLVPPLEACSEAMSLYHRAG
jgi:UPF0716 protein FxsA